MKTKEKSNVDEFTSWQGKKHGLKFWFVEDKNSAASFYVHASFPDASSPSLPN